MTLRSPIFSQSWRAALYLGMLLASLALLGLLLEQMLPINAWSLSYARLAMKGKPALDVLPAAPDGHERASVWLARDAVASGDPARALDLLSGADRDSAEDVLSASVRAGALLAQGHFPEAVGSWVQAGDYESIIEAATVAQSQARLDDAELAYRGAWRLNPVDGTLPLANFLWLGRGDPAAAEDLLRQSLATIQPANLNWLRALGLVLQAQSRWDEALVYYQQALQERPDDLYTLRLIGDVYYLGEDRPDDARTYFQRMINIAPEDASGYFAMGQLMLKQERFEEADAWLLEALSRNSDDPWMWVVRANTAESGGNLALAIDVFEETVRKFPSYPLAYYGLAGAYKLDGKPQRAILSIEQALALQEGQNAWYYVRAGEIYQWARDLSQARSNYLTALEVDPGNLAAHRAAEQYLLRLDAEGE